MDSTHVNAEAELNELIDLLVEVYVDGKKTKGSLTVDLELTVNEDDDDLHNKTAWEAISEIVSQHRSKIKKNPNVFQMIVRSAAGERAILANDDVLKSHSRTLASDGACIILVDDITDPHTLGIKCDSMNLKKKNSKQ